MQQSPARLNFISSEDEKQINHKKMREAFIAALNKKLKDDEALKEWQLVNKLKIDTESFELNSNNGNLQVHFKKDGLSIEMGKINEKTCEAAFAVYGSYQESHQQFHPKAELEFELVCNDEKEARQILTKAKQQNIPITTLKFYKSDPKTGKELPHSDQTKLLQKIWAEIPTKELSVSTRPR